MNVLLLTAYFPPEIRSASLLMGDLARELAAKGHRVTVVTAGDDTERRIGGTRIIAAGRQLNLRRRPVIRGLEQFGLAWRAALASLRIERPDVIYAYSPPLTLGLACIAARVRHRSPYVFNVQDLYPQAVIDLGILRQPLLVWGYKQLERLIYRYAACITVHSEGNARVLERRGVSRVVVVPNWVDTDEIRPGIDGSDYRNTWTLGNRFVVLFAGVIGYAQGLETVVQAAEELRQHHDILFLIVGDGSTADRLQAQVARRGLANVVFKPLQPPERYPELLAAADVGLVTLDPKVQTPVVPSKLLSIMAAGKPVIACVPRSNDTWGIVTRSECGLVVDAGDATGLAQAVLQLRNDRGKADRAGRKGREYALHAFSREAVLNELVRQLEEIAASGPPGRRVYLPAEDAPVSHGPGN